MSWVYVYRTLLIETVMICSFGDIVFTGVWASIVAVNDACVELKG